MADRVFIDFANPQADYPTEPMDWNIGNPFNVTPFYPVGGPRLSMGRVRDCAHTRYWIDGGLILELEASAVNQNFGIFVDRPAQAVNEIRLNATFDLVECLKRTIKVSNHPDSFTVPFIGSIGVVATDADVSIPLPSPANVIGATCAVKYDPDSAASEGMLPDMQRFRLNGPKSMYSVRTEYPFHQFEFLRASLTTKPLEYAWPDFELQVIATAGATAADFATSVMRLNHPGIHSPGAGDYDNGTKQFTSKFFRDFTSIKYAGVVLSITDASTNWLQPCMGPFRARIKSFTVEFRP